MIRKGALVYLAGPMSGVPEFNHVGFADAEAYAAERGWRVVSPRSTDPTHEGPCGGGEMQATAAGAHPWECWVKASLRMMLTCQAVLLLPGWQASRGARLERSVAESCGMHVMEMPEVAR